MYSRTQLYWPHTSPIKVPQVINTTKLGSCHKTNAKRPPQGPIQLSAAETTSYVLIEPGNPWKCIHQNQTPDMRYEGQIWYKYTSMWWYIHTCAMANNLLNWSSSNQLHCTTKHLCRRPTCTGAPPKAISPRGQNVVMASHMHWLQEALSASIILCLSWSTCAFSSLLSFSLVPCSKEEKIVCHPKHQQLERPELQTVLPPFLLDFWRNCHENKTFYLSLPLSFSCTMMATCGMLWKCRQSLWSTATCNGGAHNKVLESKD